MLSTQNGQVINYPKRKTLKLGSLFDGSGGFPLAAKNVGITPVWASEIEPFPILVTKKNLPQMRHMGDVNKIDGAKTEPVDAITFGSPCQDLSYAGKRAGLNGKRSSLFYQATRIIKEMRQATNGTAPRYTIWENVTGALTSNKGKDFHAVLQTLTAIADEKAASTIPHPRKWPLAGAFRGDGWSIAWRVLNAKYFGVPQMHRRIFVVCDFTGTTAPEILFETATGSKHSRPSQKMAQNDAANSRKNLKRNGRTIYRITSCHGTNPNLAKESSIAKTLTASFCCTPNNNQGGEVILEPLYVIPGSMPYGLRKNIAPTLLTDGHHAHMVFNHSFKPRRLTTLEAGRLQGFPDEWCQELAIENPDTETLKQWGAIWENWDHTRGVKPKTENQIRKWLANPVSDSAVYKLWGNGVALPVVQHILANLVEVNKSSAGNEAQEWTYSHPA